MSICTLCGKPWKEGATGRYHECPKSLDGASQGSGVVHQSDPFPYVPEEATPEKELREAIEYMAMCIGESRDERRDDTSLIFKEMEDKILAWRDAHTREAVRRELAYWAGFFEDTSMDAMTPSERLYKRLGEFDKEQGK